ncbi:MAG TPA: hypothetical protein VNU46_03990 [Gemmatimonadaceae bacterium]|jgi:hypothetical protein|nr:hypothetical protein [Gemmatimonadaceae bacterium]
MIRAFVTDLTRRFREALRSERPDVYDVHGLRVVVENSRPDIKTADVLSRFEEAIGLIERYQAWRFRHLRRDIRQFSIVRFPCRGAYLPAHGVCITELTFLARRDISAAPVAASILHEGMHARMDRMGIQPASRDLAREERICRRAELDFGRALPPELGAPVITRAEETLTLADEDVAPAIDWTEAQHRQRLTDLEDIRRTRVLE